MSTSNLITNLAQSVDSFHQRFQITGPVTRAELLTRIPIPVSYTHLRAHET